MRIVFAGTPAFAVPALTAMHRAGHSIVGVYCQPDRPAGRGQKIAVGPVKEAATRMGLAVFQPEHLRCHQHQESLAALRADLMVVVAYGLILPQAVLDLFPEGCWNIHASLLPRWRGAAPIARAIEAGDRQSGVCIMQMEAGLDTGPVLQRAALHIAPDDTAGLLQERLAALGAQLMLEALERIRAHRAGSAAPAALPGLEIQPSEGMCYATKILKSEARLDFGAEAEVLERRMRAFDPYPGCFTTLLHPAAATTEGGNTPHEDRMLSAKPPPLIKCWKARVLEVETTAPPGTIIGIGTGGPLIACGRQSLELLQGQAAGGHRVAGSVLARQLGLAPGCRLG